MPVANDGTTEALGIKKIPVCCSQNTVCGVMANARDAVIDTRFGIVKRIAMGKMNITLPFDQKSASL